MIEYDLAIGVGAIADAWLVALVALRGGRLWLQATFAALGLTLIMNAAAFVGTDAGTLPASWQLAVFASLILSYPLATILVLGIIHGESLPRRRAVIFLLLAAVPLFIFLTPSDEWTAQHAYDLNALGGFLGICLAIALAEPIYQKMTSALYSRDAEWTAFGVLVLIVGGPVYTIEFAALGLPVAAGSSFVAPLALAILAIVVLRTSAYHATFPRHWRRWSGAGLLDRGNGYVFDERRPSYALSELRREAADGRPTLLIARHSAPTDSEEGGVAVAVIQSDRSAASRVLTTAAEFLSRFRGGLVGLADLGDVSLMSGWEPSLEMLARLRSVAQDTDGTVILATACLTPAEREDVHQLGFAWWELPDPVEEIEAVLARSFGPGARQLLNQFAHGLGVRTADLTIADVPALVEFLSGAVLGRSAVAMDTTAMGALRKQSGTAVEDLHAFAGRPAVELARGEWPSKEADSSNRDLVVTADAYFRGRETAESVRPAPQVASRQSLFERALAVFVDTLGPAGEGVLRSEVAKLGKRPQELRAQDVARLADRAAVDLGAMADVTDIPQERVRIRTQIESIRRRLEAIAGVES